MPASNPMPVKKLLIAAMPSSGSDWFASCILKSTDQLISHPTAKEPLNPICNLEHFDTLAKVFGCEAEPAIEPIAACPTQEQVEEAISIALPPEVNFIKEVWVGYQLPQLAEHFQIITLTRSSINTFPPSRVRVYSWYLALAKSIEINRNLRLSQSMRQRVSQAHELYRAQLLTHSLTLSWEFLMEANRSQLESRFDQVLLSQHLDCGQLAELIISTRAKRI
jgi:hypothetical protein